MAPDPTKLVTWRHDTGSDLADPNLRVKMVGSIRFMREDGMDPRLDPEPDGTHLSNDARDINVARCGRTGMGFTAFGPITGITCPDCAAILAANLLEESRYG